MWKDIMKLFLIRFVRMMIGLFLFSVGIILIIKANIGYAPWDVFHVGIYKTVDLSFVSLGLVSILVGFVLMIIAVIFHEKLGLGTIANMVFIGIFLDIILYIDFIPVMDKFLYGLIMLIIGLFTISLGSYFYIGSGFSAGPRDSLMVVLARKTKIPVGICRSAIELSVTVAGWFLGGMVGIGTVISVIGIGFCIQITFKLLKFNVTAIKHESIKDTFFGNHKIAHRNTEKR